MHNFKILAHVKSPLESQMANIVQTLNMCEALSEHSEVKVITYSRRKSKQTIERILGAKPSFDFIICFSRLRYYLILFKGLIHNDGHIFYTRSISLALFNILIGGYSVVELHQSHFTSKKIINKLITLLLSRFDFRNLLIICISNKLKEIYQLRGVKQDILVCHDGFNSNYRPKIIPPNKKRVVYTGKVSSERSFADICRLASFFPEYKFLIVGADINQLYNFQAEAKTFSRNIRVYSKQNAKRVALLQQNASILLAFWGKDVSTMDYCSPLKIFEYMATGNKVLCHDFPVLQEVLPKCRHIEMCIPGDEQSMVQAFNRLSKTKYDKLIAHEIIKRNQKYSYKTRAANIIHNIKK